MRKQKPVALYVLSILAIIFGALYLYTRPGTIEELYDFVDLNDIDMVGGYVRVYEGDSENSFYTTQWFQPGSPEYGELMDLLRQTTFQRTLKTLTPLPETRVSPHLQPGMFTLEILYHNDVNGFALQSFYGETTIGFYDESLGVQYITIENESQWEQAIYDFVMEHGEKQEEITLDTAG